jgi:hypothetical protein
MPERTLETSTLQREVIRHFHAGASIETAHKEGGSRIHFQNGLFIHEEYGEWESRREFSDERKFLDHLWQVRGEIVSTRYGSPPLSDLEVWQAIVERLNRSPPAWHLPNKSTAAQTEAASAYFRLSRLKMWLAIVVGGITLAAALVWKVLAPVVQTRTTGTPLGTAVGTPVFIAQLISTQQPYVPSLNRDPDDDRFDVSLFIRPRDANAEAAQFKLGGDHTASASNNIARLLGFDGRLLWLLAGEIVAYDHANKRLIRLDELRRHNPGLEALWPVGYYEVMNRLVVSTRDRVTIVEIDPQSLKATPLPILPPSPHPIPPHPVDSLISDAQSSDPTEIRTSWVLGAVDALPMTFGTPESRLQIHWKKIGLPQRMLVATRVDISGEIVWTVDTGIDMLQQILPDTRITTFIGTRPAVPDKVSEPIMVMINLEDGTLTQHSLWFRG